MYKNPGETDESKLKEAQERIKHTPLCESLTLRLDLDLDLLLLD